MDFKEWLSERNLDSKTVDLLTELGITCEKAFSLLTDDTIQKHFAKKVSLGQSLLLTDAVKKCKTATTTPEKEVGNMGLSADEIRLLAQPPDEGKSDLETFNLLPETKSKAKQICDFLTLKQQNSTQAQVTLGDFQLKLRDGAKPKLDSVSPAQYLEGSMRILLDLISKEGMTMPDVIHHVEYLMKIGTFAQGFAWSSVLQYDAEFRRLQKEKKRPWNLDDTYLMQLHLRNRQPYPERQGAQAQKSTAKTFGGKNKFDPRTGLPICEKFNGKNGCNFTNCKYAHVCMSCYASEHNDFTHKADQKRDNRGTNISVPTSDKIFSMGTGAG